MTRGPCRQNNGPCIVCGVYELQKPNEKFRKLTLEAFTKIKYSPVVSLLTVNLQVGDQLCIKHYNELVSYKRNTQKFSIKCNNNNDLAYNSGGGQRKKICLREEEYHDLLNNVHSVEILQ